MILPPHPHPPQKYLLRRRGCGLYPSIHYQLSHPSRSYSSHCSISIIAKSTKPTISQFMRIMQGRRGLYDIAAASPSISESQGFRRGRWSTDLHQPHRNSTHNTKHPRSEAYEDVTFPILFWRGVGFERGKIGCVCVDLGRIGGLAITNR